MITRTEYAVRYTDIRNGKATPVVTETDEPTERERAESLVGLNRTYQASTEGKLPVDAHLVTRTVTITDWAQ